MSLSIQRYTAKSIVVRGDTKARLKDLQSFAPYGKFGNYGGQPGWVFPLTMEAQVRARLGIHTPYVEGPAAPSEEEKAARRTEWLNKKSGDGGSHGGSSFSISDLLLKRTDPQVVSAASYAVTTPVAPAASSATSAPTPIASFVTLSTSSAPGTLRGPPPVEDADDDSVPPEALVALQKRIDELEQRVKILEAMNHRPVPEAKSGDAVSSMDTHSV